MDQEVVDVAVDLEGSLVELRKHWNGGAMTRWWWCLRERENRGTREREQSGGGGDEEGGELGCRGGGSYPCAAGGPASRQGTGTWRQGHGHGGTVPSTVATGEMKFSEKPLGPFFLFCFYSI